MKKLSLLLLMILLTTITVSAENMIVKSIAFSMQKQENNKWGNWSEWEPSSLKIDIDLDKKIVKIYSSKTQVYNIVDFLGATEDNGDTTATFQFIDQDGDIGQLRMHERKNGRSEIYIDFDNVRWAYIVEIE